MPKTRKRHTSKNPKKKPTISRYYIKGIGKDKQIGTLKGGYSFQVEECIDVIVGAKCVAWYKAPDGSKALRNATLVEELESSYLVRFEGQEAGTSQEVEDLYQETGYCWCTINGHCPAEPWNKRGKKRLGSCQAHQKQALALSRPDSVDHSLCIQNNEKSAKNREKDKDNKRHLTYEVLYQHVPTFVPKRAETTLPLSGQDIDMMDEQQLRMGFKSLLTRHKELQAKQDEVVKMETPALEALIGSLSRQSSVASVVKHEVSEDLPPVSQQHVTTTLSREGSANSVVITKMVKSETPTLESHTPAFAEAIVDEHRIAVGWETPLSSVGTWNDGLFTFFCEKAQW